MIQVKATVVPIEKPKPPKAAPVVPRITAIRGQITTKDERKIMGYRKIFLGSPEYRVAGKEFPSDQVSAFRRDEYICQPHQSYDPQAYLP
jgi:hypothetical protein